jgi:hypothetical protein
MNYNFKLIAKVTNEVSTPAIAEISPTDKTLFSLGDFSGTIILLPGCTLGKFLKNKKCLVFLLIPLLY